LKAAGTRVHGEENSKETLAVIPQIAVYTKQLVFCEKVLGIMERDEGLSKRIIFSEETTSHLSGKVNRHNIWIWGSEKPVPVVEMECDSPKVNVFCAVSRRCVFRPFFVEKSVTGQVYLKMLQKWLMPKFAEEKEFIFRDNAPPHWHMSVREYINGNLPGRWSGHASATDKIFCTWPTQSPDLTVCDFFLWGFVKDNVYSPPLPKRHRQCHRECHRRHA
jgi:hypothetical protein